MNLRNSCAGRYCKPPCGALVKSYGIERVPNSEAKISQQDMYRLNGGRVTEHNTYIDSGMKNSIYSSPNRNAVIKN